MKTKTIVKIRNGVKRYTLFVLERTNIIIIYC